MGAAPWKDWTIFSLFSLQPTTRFVFWRLRHQLPALPAVSLRSDFLQLRQGLNTISQLFAKSVSVASSGQTHQDRCDAHLAMLNCQKRVLRKQRLKTELKNCRVSWRSFIDEPLEMCKSYSWQSSFCFAGSEHFHSKSQTIKRERWKATGLASDFRTSFSISFAFPIDSRFQKMAELTS